MMLITKSGLMIQRENVGMKIQVDVVTILLTVNSTIQEELVYILVDLAPAPMN